LRVTTEARADPALDVATTLAIATLAYGAANVVHEGLGHGLACHLLGGEFAGFGTSFSVCQKAFSPAESAWFQASGTLAAMAAGATAAFALHARPPRSPRVGYFAWLFAAITLIQGAAYVAIDSIVGLADWQFVRLGGGLPAQVASVFAATLVFAGATRALRPFITPYLGTVRRTRRAVVLVVLPWLLVGGVLMTAAALRGPEAGRAHFVLSAVYFNLGCGALLPAWVLVTRRPAVASSGVRALGRRPACILAAVALAIVALTILGPGLSW